MTSLLAYILDLGRPMLVGEGLKLYPWTFFFFFYQSIALSSHPVDGHQMYSEGSIVGKDNWYTDLVTLPLIFTGSKSAKFGVV